ncbi:transposase [Thermoflexus sp.]|uniref:transposase n=1 Tax=Thermoflexus sp. TaxID=1969742 RepID=UPI0025EAD391|nr:transposase [Thermoflexus sp.]MCS7352380.1 transposase [Thermoflexus sp.]MCX7691223.1 transposase [Thermoflexus sp.]MDW8181846.1 transposase [Anaerolineae bacterium]MDW8183710.1 transposase [Anaerolineae bacterium]
MGYDPHRHHRRSIRLKGYDYTRPGAYFVTIVTQGRLCLFGDIWNGEVLLNEAGKMVEKAWSELPTHYPGVCVDAFVVMPNHVHGIIILTRVSPYSCSQNRLDSSHKERPTLSLSDVVHRFKTITTRQYVEGVRTRGWTPFHRRLWQRNYWERIIRDEFELQRIREYIVNNPSRWHLDRENPINF